MRILSLWHYKQIDDLMMTTVNDSMDYSFRKLAEKHDFHLLSLASKTYPYFMKDNIKFYFVKTPDELLRYANNIRPEIVLLNDFNEKFNNTILDRYKGKAKFILYYHGGDIYNNVATRWREISALVVAHNFQKEQLVAHGVDKTKIFINPYGADINIMRPNLLLERIYDVVYVSYFNHYKRQQILIDSLRTFNGSVLLVGHFKDNPYLGGSWLQERIKQANDLNKWDRLTFVSWPCRDRISSFINMAKIGFFGGGNHESGPRVVPEMMACGLPVVAFNDCTAVKTFVTNETGWLVEPHAVKLGNLLNSIISDNSSIIAKSLKAEKMIRDDFSYDTMANRWEEVLNSI